YRRIHGPHGGVRCLLASIPAGPRRAAAAQRECGARRRARRLVHAVVRATLSIRRGPSAAPAARRPRPPRALGACRDRRRGVCDRALSAAAAAQDGARGPSVPSLARERRPWGIAAMNWLAIMTVMLP